MISVRQALQIVLDDVRPVGAEMVALTEACGRVVAEDTVSPRDVPSFANSAMDGFAVRAADVATLPARLQVIEVIGAGVVPRHIVQPGTAAKIMTGAVMPEGADTVIKVEDTQESDGYVRLDVRGSVGGNVRLAGEDIGRGDTVLQRGHCLRPADIGVLASIGAAVVRVQRRPTVAIVSTGDELVELGQPLQPGQIVNSNAYTLAAAVHEAGGVARILGIVGDDEAQARAVFAQAFAADIVVSTGGVSMGVFDLVRQILASLGVEEKFWKVAQKPGKPLAFGRREGRAVFGLPGNPVSALVCFYVYVLPLIRKLLGVEAIHLPTLTAPAAEDMRASNGLTDFIRCIIAPTAAGFQVRPTGSQSSAVLRSLSLGQGLIVAAPEVAAIKAGSPLTVIRLVEPFSVVAAV